jgi:hypothetical protein
MKQVQHFARAKGAPVELLTWLTRLALALGALALSLLLPPQVAFRAEPLPALALSLAGALALLLPKIRWRFKPRLKAEPQSPPTRAKRREYPVFKRAFYGQNSPWRWLHIAIQVMGFLLLCSVMGWDMLSQVIPLNMPVALVESLRALPVVTVAGLAALLLARPAWQRRALVALLLPTLLALSFVAMRTPPFVLDFRPYWLAADGHGTLYVTDVESPVIRVFAPDGSLHAKLRPRIAALQGPPGTGFSPPGPWNDPDQLGVPSLTGQPQNGGGWLRPWPPNTDEFLFCGLAIDDQNRLYVLDWLGNQVLRFTPDGLLDEMWPLPKDYQPTTGCLALSQGRLYVGDQRGQVLTYDLTGHLLASEKLPGPLTGLSVDHSGHLYALLSNHIWRETLASHQVMIWNLPPPRGPLGFPYETLLALNSDQLLVSDLNTNRILRYTGEGRLLGVIGGAGNQPGQFAGVGAMTMSSDGHLYVTDSDHRVVQRFAPDGAVDGLYRGPDDDEND